MKKSVSFTVAVCLCLFLSMILPYAAADGLENFARNKKPVPTFSDVLEDDWFCGYVRTVAGKGLMVGNSPATFNPHGKVTLAETVTIAARLHSIYHTGQENFQQGKVWYQVYLDYAEKNGIMMIKASDYNRKATRGEFAQIVASAFPAEALAEINVLSGTHVPDVTLGMSCGEAVYTLYRAGILTGNDAAGTFAPYSNIKRCEVAAIITRMAMPEERVVLKMEQTEILPEQKPEDNTQQGTPTQPETPSESETPQKPDLNSPSLCVQSVEAKAGQTQVAVTVSVKNNPGVAALGLTLSYDNDLALRTIVYNKQLGGNAMQPQSMDNPVKMLWLNPFQNVTGDFVLATVYFDVSDAAKNGNHQIAVSYNPDNVYDIGENNVRFETVQGGILVK